MRHCARVGGAAMNRDRILHITYRKRQPPGATSRPRPAGAWGRGRGEGEAPSAPALLRILQHAELGVEHIFGGELYVAPEGVALQPPECLDHGRGESHGTHSGRSMRKEWVFRSQEEWNAARRMCLKRARVKYDPSRNANGPANVGCAKQLVYRGEGTENGAGAAEAEPPSPPPPPRKGSVFDAVMRKLPTPRSGSRVRSLYCRWTPGSKRH